MEILILALIAIAAVFFIARHIRKSFKEDDACRNCKAGNPECRRSKKCSIIILIFVTGVFFLSGCALFKGDGLREYNQTRPYMGAYVTIRCFYDSKKDISAAINRCWRKMDQIEARMNAYSAKGDVVEINKNGYNGVQVHDDVYNIIKDSIKYSKLTGGAFDITVFPLMKLWKNSAREGRAPEPDALEDARNRVGYQSIRLEPPDRVIFEKKGMKIELGAIAAGYALDEIDKILSEDGIKNFLIDTSGEILCRGEDAGKRPWRIGVQDPQNKMNLLMTLELKDRSVSTSGDYEKYYVIGKERFSHIIDPFTGYPQKDAISATVIADTGEEADALSTAFCVIGGEKSLKLIRTLKNIEALVIEKKDGKIIKYQTDGFHSIDNAGAPEPAVAAVD